MSSRSIQAALAVLLVGLAYGGVSGSVPFYYSWDMDWLTTLDALVIQGGRLPDHVHHTSFGMYLVLAWSQRIASALGGVSFLDLSDADGAGNPLVGVAELTDYFRAHTPIVLVAIVLAQAAGLRGIGRLASGGARARGVIVRSRPFVLLTLLLVALQEGVLYQALLIRSEVYSLLFWCLALATAVGALRARSRRTSLLRFGLCGLFLALAWATKLQAIVLVAWLLLVVALLRDLGWSRSPVVGLEVASGRARLLPGLGLFIAASSSIISAARFNVPQGMASFVDGYRPNTMAVVSLAVFAAPLLLAVCHRRLPALEALLAGALGAGLLHLLLHTEPRVGWTHLLVDVKMLLFRAEFQSLSQVEPMGPVRRVMAEVAGAPGLFVTHLCLLALVVRCLPSWRRRGALLLVELALFGHFGLATRDFLRDDIWVQLPLTVSTVILSITLLSRPRLASGRAAGVLCLLALSLLAQVRALVVARPLLDAHSLTYNWTVERFLEGVYEREQRRYGALIEAKVDPADRARWVRGATAQARDWRQVRQDLRHVLVNQAESLRDVTVAEAGFLLPHDPEARLVAVPPPLRGGLLVRPREWVPDGGDLLVGASVRSIRDDPQWHVRVAASSQRLGFLGRPDLDVVLFLPAGPRRLDGWVAGAEQMEVATATSVARFGAHRFDLYGEVDVEQLAGGAFLVIKRRF
jgi:hypothetical protein